MPDALGGVLAAVPPWLILALLLGVMNGAACYLLLGRRLIHLLWYTLIGALAASVGQVFAQAIAAPAPVQIGELNVLVASLAVWVVLAIARAAGL